MSVLSASDIIQLMGIIIALILGIGSIIIAVITLRQNSKMIEESTKPVIAIYGESINPGDPIFYLVVKNFGQTSATITKFDYDYDFYTNHGYLEESVSRDYLKDLITANLAPGQSKVCLINYKNINQPVTFSIEYKTATNTYTDQMTVNLKAGIAMLTKKINSTEGDLHTISYTLQEMLQKNL
ncbi:hypothetical protein [Anaerosporobacter sp.]